MRLMSWLLAVVAAWFLFLGSFLDCCGRGRRAVGTDSVKLERG